MSVCWRPSSRPKEKVNRLAEAHGVHEIPEPGTSQTDTTHGIAPATTAIVTARVSEPRCHDVYSVIITTRKNVPSRLPAFPTTSVTGRITRAANSSAGILGASPRTTNAANATASTNSSVVEPGSLT